MSKDHNCYECGEIAHYVDIDYPFHMYCIPCIRVMYPPLEQGEDNG